MSAPTRVENPWSMPGARTLLPANAPRDLWLSRRRRGYGSSDVALLMGVAAGGSEYELWLDKMGLLPDQQSEAMRRGVWLEPHVVQYFAEQTGLGVRRCGLIRKRSNQRALATPDRLTADGGVLEVKTIGAHAKVAAEWRRGGIARHAYVQLQWQLGVSGRSHGWLAAYELDHPPQIRGPIDRDEALIERIADRAEEWWVEHVVTRNPPLPDLATITDEEIALRWPTAAPGTSVQAEWPAHVRSLLAERAELKVTEKTAKDRTKEIDQALRVMAGDAEALLVGERPVVTFKSQLNNPAVDPALESDHPDIWAGYIRRGSSRRIHICAGWEKA
jgi:putative phage-type endonuclease